MILVKLLRRKNSEEVDPYKESANLLAIQKQLRNDMYVFALTEGPEIADLYLTRDSEITGMEHFINRERDIWESLFLLGNKVDAENGNTALAEALRS